ncbi:MAG TPA: hypothetical protein VEA36_03070 [Candidatus Paceibacterota bacterium]|nr:hypothetical protein [Candidatus Paceibacterota bacterium]
MRQALASLVLVIVGLIASPAAAGIMSDTAKCTTWVRENVHYFKDRIGVTEAEAYSIAEGFRYQMPDGSWRTLTPRGASFWGGCYAYVRDGGDLSKITATSTATAKAPTAAGTVTEATPALPETTTPAEQPAGVRRREPELAEAPAPVPPAAPVEKTLEQPVEKSAPKADPAPAGSPPVDGTTPLERPATDNAIGNWLANNLTFAVLGVVLVAALGIGFAAGYGEHLERRRSKELPYQEAIDRGRQHVIATANAKLPERVRSWMEREAEEPLEEENPGGDPAHGLRFRDAITDEPIPKDAVRH